MNHTKLKALMKERKVKNIDLAGEIGTSATFVSYLVTGKKTPSVATLKRIANYFNVPMDDLA